MNIIHQGKLETVVHQLFPGQKILINARREAQIKNPITGSFLEIDIFLPSLNLGFEFQDTYHYTDTWDSHLPLEYVRRKDKAVRKRNETLILVPCWWDGSTESLSASIVFQRPDLQFYFHSCSLSPIPLAPTVSFFKEGKVNGVGELMLASFPTDPSFDISPDNHWWIGEKYDGIRFCYSADAKQTFTRSSAVLNLPEIFLDNFPPVCMDGEIWFGRGSFLESQKLVISPYLHSIQWSLLRAVIFDEPSLSHRMQPFEVPPRIQCTSHYQMAKMIKIILKDKGEGVVLRKPKSIYEPGRSSNLLKLKAMRGDKEALIVEVLENQLLVLQLPDGNTFSTLPSDYTAIDPPAVGDIVSFSFENFTRSSIPVKPKIFRIRKDLSWKDIVTAYQKEEKEEKYKKTGEVYAPKPQGYWSEGNGKNMRQLLEKYAKRENLDPLAAESWYSFAHQLRYKKGIGVILRKFKGSIVRALTKLFPEILFQINKFEIPPRDYWKSVVNRREFMKNWAEVKGFDPLMPEHWNSFSQKDLIKVKKMSSILGYYKKHSKALSHLFPEVQGLPSKAYWLDIGNRKLFFENFAKKHDFDPLAPDPWYSVNPQLILSEQGGKIVLSFYRGSWITALTTLFPYTKFEDSKFLYYPKNYWRDSKNQRRFFEDFAKDNSFNSISPTPWYSVTLDSILSAKNGGDVLSYYKGSFVRALLSLFPEVKFQECKFLNLPVEYWTSPQNQKQMFVAFAQDNHFDPLSPIAWYNASISAVQSYPNAKLVLSYHKRSVVLALLSLFPDIGFERENFANIPRNFWKDINNRRNFFDKIARENKFDPLIGANWLNFTKDDVTSRKGGISIMHIYKGDIKVALEDIYPKISFNIIVSSNENEDDKEVTNAKLARKIKERDIADNGDKRRHFFISLAKQKGFDPSSIENWYKMHETAVLSQKGSAKVLSMYKGNFIEALKHSLPELKLDSQKFLFPPQSYWLSRAIRQGDQL